MAKKKYFAFSPIRKLMRDSGAELVSRNAVEEVINQLEEHVKLLTKKAVKFAKHSNRKKVDIQDVKLANTV